MKSLHCVVHSLVAAFLYLLLVGGPTFPSETQETSIEQTLKEILGKQEAAWNRGDIDGFMEYYWKSDQVTYTSGGNVRRGWQTAKDSYKERYPSRERMGVTRLFDLEVTLLCDSGAMVMGRWELQRQPDPIGGIFTVVFQKIDGKWVIIHDHTSKREKKDQE